MDSKTLLRTLIEASKPWTQNKVASKLGISSQAMSNRMNAKGSLRAEFVADVLGVLGYDLIAVPSGSRRPAGSIQLDSNVDDQESQ